MNSYRDRTFLRRISYDDGIESNAEPVLFGRHRLWLAPPAASSRRSKHLDDGPFGHDDERTSIPSWARANG